MPSRGSFTFPAPYNTRGARLTNAGDCGGNNCLNYVGYSYWRNINNHTGSDSLLAFVSLDRSRGGSGPTLFEYNKVTRAVTNRGALFASSDSRSYATGEGWYFSATQPTRLYLNDGPRLVRYDVVARTSETVFDAAARYGAGYTIWQIHSSNDDRVHSATLRNGSGAVGCMVYKEATQSFTLYSRQGAFDECQIDKGGRYLVIKENVDGANGEDNRIIDLVTGTEKLLLDQNGAAGHSDNGYGTMIAEDNWASVPGAARVWTLDNPTSGFLAYRTTSWSVDLGHVSFANAIATRPLNEQYACASRASSGSYPRANEIVCFRLDTSQDVLVVAPVLTNMGTGGGDSYTLSPKGNIDVTGGYFIWTSNLGGNRLDALLVEVPGQLLVPSLATTTTGGGSTTSGDGNTSGTGGGTTPSGDTNSSGGTTPSGDTTANVVADVRWTNRVNTVAYSGSLRKNSGSDGVFNAGATSVQSLRAGDGYLEFGVPDNGRLFYAGLGRGAATTTAGEITFAIRVQSGVAEVREAGIYRADTRVNSGDVFRVDVKSGVVRYLRNGNVFYQSGRRPDYPLIADTAFAGLGARISNAKLSYRP